MKCFLRSLLLLITAAVQAQTTYIYGPLGESERFGGAVTVLPNGNYVVQDYKYDNGNLQDVGAVYLYNGRNHSLISTLTGNQSFDRIGIGPVIVLNNSNFLVRSPYWQDPLTGNADVGAVTWVNGTSGLNAVVNASNSLVGSHAGDKIGADGITVLSNNNYVVRSISWQQNVSNQHVGAVTWGSGNTGISGVVSSSNSLVGSKANDQVGFYPLTVLANGNYVVSSPYWDNVGATDAGAVTWCSGTTGRSGIVSSSNSLVGSTPFDEVGNNPFLLEAGITSLTNGNYVVNSPNWDNGGTLDHAGAATWANGATGIAGEINNSNSMVGSHAADYVGAFVTPLSNGNYVINSPYWANSIFELAGAATWGSGATGISGEINSSNSLIGSQQNDGVGGGGITALANGNYVVCSSSWANGSALAAGAATWANGTTGISGFVNSGNSLVGTQANDQVGISGAVALANSNYVVCSYAWANGVNTIAGAVTWGNGNTGISGSITSSNSLVGTKTNDQVGLKKVKALANGNYVVGSPYWTNGAGILAGAVTWGNGNTGITGLVNSVNSLVGTHTNDRVGEWNIVELTNGNYVVCSPYWSNGAIANAGAVTWGNGVTGITGIVSNTNSLVGSHADDYVGSNDLYIIPLANGNYVVDSYQWNNGAISKAGAVTFCNGSTGSTGVVSSVNSLVGSTTNDQVGYYNVKALPNGNYLVYSINWHNGASAGAGAVTWGSGVNGITGFVSAANSLVGTVTDDQVGTHGITVFNNGNYAVRSFTWTNGALAYAGAVTFGNGSNGVAGVINSCNSVLGSTAQPDPLSFLGFPVAYNDTYSYMLVGKPENNIVNIYNPTGMALAAHLDIVTQNITGNSPTAMVVPSGCRIVATVEPTGTSNALSGSVVARVWKETSQPAQFVKRHYEITPSLNASTATGRVTLYFTQQEFDDFNLVNTLKLPIDAADAANNKANLRIEKRSGISADGTGLPASYSTLTAPETINPADADIFYNGTFGRWEVSFTTTGFSGFFAKTQAVALPLTLLDFSGTKQAGYNQLQWQTASEVNTKNFELQSGIDGNSFSTAAVVMAAGSGNNNYQFNDNKAYTGSKTFYRLKMVDIDGRFTYSKTIVINNPVNGQVNIYPNPAKEVINIQLNNTGLLHSKAGLYDTHGRLLQSMLLTGQQQKINIQSLAAGIYLLQLKDGSIFKVVKE